MTKPYVPVKVLPNTKRLLLDELLVGPNHPNPAAEVERLRGHLIGCEYTTAELPKIARSSVQRWHTKALTDAMIKPERAANSVRNSPTAPTD